MKNILVIASVSMLLLAGCGSDDDSDKKEKKEFSDLSKISLGFNQSSRLEQNQNSRITTNKMTNTVHKKSFNRSSFKKISTHNKIDSYECGVSGSYTDETKADVKIENNNNCIYYDEETGLNIYENGKVAYYTGDNTIKIVYENYLYSPNTNEDYYFEGDATPYYTGWSTDYFEMESSKADGIEIVKLHGSTKDYIKDKPLEENTFSNVIMKKNIEKQSWYFEGSITFKVSCYNKTYTFKTKNDAWLIEDSENPDHYTKGAIDVNNIRYSYNGTNITLSTQEEEQTFEQKELEKLLADNIEKELSKCHI